MTSFSLAKDGETCQASSNSPNSLLTSAASSFLSRYCIHPSVTRSDFCRFLFPSCFVEKPRHSWGYVYVFRLTGQKNKFFKISPLITKGCIIYFQPLRASIKIGSIYIIIRLIPNFCRPDPRKIDLQADGKVDLIGIGLGIRIKFIYDDLTLNQ